MYILRYDKRVEKDLARLTKIDQAHIKKAVEKKLLTYPRMYGEGLKGSLQLFMRLRVGEFRIIYHLPTENEVYVVMIAHRRAIYADILKRLGLSS